jgi:transcriptional regulator with XRE-family HTH domain
LFFSDIAFDASRVQTWPMHQPGTNIRTLRSQMGMTAKQLAKAADVEYTTLNRLENGKGGYSREGLERIAKALNVTVGVLFADAMTVDAAALGIRRLPRFTMEQLRLWEGPESNEFDLDSDERIVEDIRACSRFAFAVVAEGEANADTIQPGDDLVFDPRVQPRPGSFAVARDSERNLYIGRLRLLSVTGDLLRWEIVPVSRFHPSASNEGIPGLTILGTLIQIRRPMPV